MKFAVGFQLYKGEEEPFSRIVETYREKISEVFFPWLDIPTGRSNVATLHGYTDWTAQARLEEEEKERKAKEKERAAKRSTTSRSRSTSGRSTSSRKRQSSLEKAVNKTISSTANTVGRELGKQIARGLLGNFLRK